MRRASALPQSLGSIFFSIGLDNITSYDKYKGMMKLKKNIQHDKIWLKATNETGKSCRFYLGRGGWRITGDPSMKSVMVKMRDLWKEATDAGFKYGEAIDYMEGELL